jgi:hypothetical protein
MGRLSITLQCPSCGGETSFAADASLFACDYCGHQHVFVLPRRALAEQQAPRRSLLSRPRKVTIEKRGQSLDVTWYWFTWVSLLLALFATICMCSWCDMFQEMIKVDWTGGVDLGSAFLILGFLAFVMGLVYLTLVGSINHSRLRATPGVITVRHGPMPWRRGAKVPTSDLEQLYCERVGDSESPSYSLCAVLKGGHKQVLLPNLNTPTTAVFIEQQVESWLKLPDRQVIGEVVIDD